MVLPCPLLSSFKGFEQMTRTTFIAASLSVLWAVAGCGTTTTDTSTTTRSAIQNGKADQTSGSCDAQCGGQSTTGPCWCDDQCASFGDCCFDKVPLCTPEQCDDLDAGPCTDATGCRNSILPIPCDCVPGEDAGCVCPLGGARTCVPCPLLACDLECDLGVKTDANGCGLCECNEPTTCESRTPDTCEQDPDCELRILPIPCDCAPDDQGCACPLGGALTCGARCQPILCELYCPDGFETDESGCGVCQCKETGPTACIDLDYEQCEARADCKTQIVPIPCDCDPADSDCFCPLGGQLQCVDACAPVLCELYCPGGFATGPDGCEVCACDEPAPEGCAGLDPEVCAETPGCEVTIAPVPCDCDPTDPDCVCPLGGALTCRDACAPILCTLFCENGFATDENGCGICSCAEPPDACAGLPIAQCHESSDCEVGIAPIPCDCDPDDSDCVCPLGGQQFCYAK